jgi:hypothetical protein
MGASVRLSSVGRGNWPLKSTVGGPKKRIVGWVLIVLVGIVFGLLYPPRGTSCSGCPRPSAVQTAMGKWVSTSQLPLEGLD